MNGTVTEGKMTPERVLDLARQARLGLTEEEAATLAPRLQTVLEAAEQLHEVDVAGVEAAVHVQQRVNVLREDETGASLSNEAALQDAPDVQDGFFKVPRLHEQ